MYFASSPAPEIAQYEEGSYLRLVDFVSLNSKPRVIKKKKKK